MKEINIHNLNKEFENRVRLGIMSALMVNEWISFGELKKILSLTDGNLGSHTLSLESKKYIEVRKAFIGKKPETSYRVTDLGKKAFMEHIDALSKVIKEK